MVVLFFGDIFGSPGRAALAHGLPALKERYRPDFIFGNAENLAGGRGVNRKVLEELSALGFDGFTSGNHIWDNKEVFSILDHDSRLLRPANFPDPAGMECPGRGAALFVSRAGKKVLLVNLMGRVFMDAIGCPFEAVDRILADNDGNYPVLVDMHAETTSEKAAMGWYLDGKVAAVVGTHTHVQTADERVLPKGTGFITDIGMTGAFDSCIGMDPKVTVERFRTKRRVPFEVGDANPGYCAVVLRLREDGTCQSIERVRDTVSKTERGRG